MLNNDISPHIPVMLNEMLEYMSPRDGEIYIDATFGAGGYSKAILAEAKCKLFAIDRDISAIEYAKKIDNKNFKLLTGNFSMMQQLLADENINQVNGIVLDVGVSSMQLDIAERGFSFMHDGPLDMRMGDDEKNAHYFVNNLSEEEIANTIFQYGDERLSRKIANYIVNSRKEEEIKTTYQLKKIIHKAYGFKFNRKIDPATKTFQAIRIWVNEELDELSKALNVATKLLAVNGRLVIVTFHSLEDKIVKNFLNKHSGKVEGSSRYLPDFNIIKRDKIYKIITKKAIKPSNEEVMNNPRARSAKLRAAVKLS